MCRKRRVICGFAAGTILLAGYVWRVVTLNLNYPGPEVRSAGEGESLTIGNYVWKLEEMNWRDGSYLKEAFPNYVVAFGEDGREYPTEKECILLIRISISKNQADDTWLDLTEAAFESGAWHNQFDSELFELLNPKVPVMGVELGAKSSVEVIFPVVLLEDNFTAKQWNEVGSGEMKIDTVLSCYPVKYVLEGKR